MVTTVSVWCRVCNNSFRGRIDSEYCSARCRKAAYLHRRAEAGSEPAAPDRVAELRQEMQEVQASAEEVRLQLVDSTGALVRVTSKMQELQADMLDFGDDFGDDD